MTFKKEKLSCAYTLSDMEIFVFPDLMYNLVIANIMSPIIWDWKKDAWFKNISKMTPYKKVHRIKQFIMDNFVFNLDLDTWGLTTKEEEINRFKDFIDMDVLKHSNALFGYEGDKYYFDIDIRKHFGLDKYTTNIIPYWKTETIEAMDAFKYKDFYDTGAGECVSLAVLYVAALFVIGEIPLRDMFMIGTPLHSQNFILIKEGIITNNRRILTSPMWFNGTETSAKARRALENEKVSMVSHISGYIHTMYEKAHINSKVYDVFKEKLLNFLNTKITAEIFINFLRVNREFCKYFQVLYVLHGSERYIELEKVFCYEHSSSMQFNIIARKKFLKEIDDDEFHFEQISNKIILNNIEDVLCEKSLDLHNKEDKKLLEDLLKQKDINSSSFIKKISEFVSIKPKLPGKDKEFISNNEVLNIKTGDTREEILNYIIAEHKNGNSNAEQVLHCYRAMDIISWEPFLKAGLERNPVSIEGLKAFSDKEIFQNISCLKEQSIYSVSRLAQPDEVWNFKTGDGVEKAILMANILKAKYSEEKIDININNEKVELICKNQTYYFKSKKKLSKDLII